MPDRIDALVHHMQPPARDPMIDGFESQAERMQLASRNNAVLPCGKPRNPKVGWAALTSHTKV